MNAPVLVTSLSPKLGRLDARGEECGADYQRDCISSWIAAGVRIISVNPKGELDALVDRYGDVTFVASDTAFKVVPGKPLVAIGEMLAVGRAAADGTPYGLVNSDIRFLGTRTQMSAIADHAMRGFAYGHRAEQGALDTIPGQPYLYGYDMVLLRPDADYAAQMAEFAIGTPWWDYALLALLASRERESFSIASPLVSHLTHDQKWNDVAWRSRLALTIRLLAREVAGDPAQVLDDPLHRSWEFFAEYLDLDGQPGHLADGFIGYFGPVFGMALVRFIRERTRYHLFFPETVEQGALRFADVPIVRAGIWPSMRDESDAMEIAA